ncbi:hypothetical protein [Tianweitania sediminis]|uniref:Flagellar FliJ protein n=1 Tax=Tianweitania sediminis TaxID=1502156 RepID=A0A8J7RQE9_9HYPH|nr:hypothetical protein [Tianweitania sediminis]MBP0441261.1 hypothetical protein [Tianweitania sediminis]
MDERIKRLGDLASVQNRIRGLHEARYATLLAQAMAAGQEAEDISRRSYAEDSLADLFPDVYARRVADALRRRDEALLQADAAGKEAMAAKLRAERLHEAHSEARSHQDRQSGDRDRLEALLARPPSDRS